MTTINSTSQLVVNMAERAIENDWTDKTFYGDPDCDLSQIFVRGSRVLTVTWAGEGVHRTILSVELRSTQPLQRRRDGVLYYNEVDDQGALMAGALMALYTDPIS